MQLNPILSLELRARWRMNRSHLLLLGVTLALSLLAGFIYQRAVVESASASYDALTGATSAAITSGNARASAVGRALFTALAHVNIGVWMIIAAASAATGIARERERGLLESLQLSRMSALSQVAARFESNLLLLGALQLTLMPIYAVAFLMGGVATGEIAIAFLLVAASSVLGTAAGFWVSARSHRPTGALFVGLGIVAGWSLAVCYLLPQAIELSRWAVRPMTPENSWLLLMHPNAVFWMLTDTSVTPTWLTPPAQVAGRVALLWLALSALLVWSATRNVNRTLPSSSWQGGSAWVERLRARQAAASQRSERRSKASGALLADLPLDRFVRFSNPLLAREVKSRFRLRRAGFWVGLVRFGVFIGAVALWLWGFSWLFDVPTRPNMAPAALSGLLIAGTLTLSVLAATSWTREREAGTWESLKLSLLPPRAILRAKWLSPLISLAYYGAPLWGLLVLSALFADPFSFGISLAIVVGWLGLAVALGLWFSWRIHNGTAAIAWTAGLLMLLLVGVPALNSLVGIDNTLAQWRFGVGGSDYTYGVVALTPGKPQYDPALVERYTAATGRTVMRPHLSYAKDYKGVMRPYWDYTDAGFERWLQDQTNAARAYKANMRALHPLGAIDHLFRNPGDQRNYFPVDNSTLLASVLFPLALTALLMALLRRDVRREQLNA